MPENTNNTSTNTSTNQPELTEEEKKLQAEKEEKQKKAEEERKYRESHTDPEDEQKGDGKDDFQLSGKNGAKAIDGASYANIGGVEELQRAAQGQYKASSSEINAIGKSWPLIQIGSHKLSPEELKMVEIDCTGFLPKIYVSYSSISSDMLNDNQTKEGTIISLFLNPTDASFKSIRADFILKNDTSKKKSQWYGGHQGELTKTSVAGELYIPNWYNSKAVAGAYAGTSRDALVAIAKKLKLGFFFNDEENTRDAEIWYGFNMPSKNDLDDETAKYLHNQEDDSHKSAAQATILNIAAHAYKNFTSFYDCWIDLRYGLSFININKQLGEDGLDEAIDVIPFQKAITATAAKDAKADKTLALQKADAKTGKTAALPKVLTNVDGDQLSLSPFFVIKLNIINQAREITDIIGIDKVLNYVEGAPTQNRTEDYTLTHFKFSIPYNETKLENGFYILIGPGQEPSYKQGDVLKSYVPGNQQQVGGQLSNTMADGDYEIVTQTKNNKYTSGLHNKFYAIAKEHNRINLLQLLKKVVEMTCNGLNFGIMRGEKIPALIVDHDKLSQAMAVHTDHLMQRSIISEYSGWFIVDGIRYIYKAPSENQLTKGTQWRTELRLVRREWPIPGESIFEGTSDEIRRGEQADGLDIITLDHSSGSIANSYKDNQFEEAQWAGNKKDVSLNGLAAFMITLWDYLQTYIAKGGDGQNKKKIQLVQGRWWACNKDNQREDGLPWVTYGDEYKCFTEEGTTPIYIKTTVSNHFFGEAINIAYEDGDDALLDRICRNHVILSFMYRNGISAYKETWIDQSGLTSQSVLTKQKKQAEKDEKKAAKQTEKERKAAEKAEKEAEEKRLKDIEVLEKRADQLNEQSTKLITLLEQLNNPEKELAEYTDAKTTIEKLIEEYDSLNKENNDGQHNKRLSEIKSDLFAINSTLKIIEVKDADELYSKLTLLLDTIDKKIFSLLQKLNEYTLLKADILRLKEEYTAINTQILELNDESEMYLTDIDEADSNTDTSTTTSSPGTPQTNKKGETAKAASSIKVIKTIHFGTNTSNQAEFWNRVFAVNPNNYDKYAAYYQWNIHNYTDPRKSIFDEKKDEEYQKQLAELQASNLSQTDGNADPNSNGTPSTINVSDIKAGEFTGKSAAQKKEMIGIKGGTQFSSSDRGSLEGSGVIINHTFTINGKTKKSIPIHKSLINDLLAIFDDIYKKMPSFNIYGLSNTSHGSGRHQIGCAIDINAYENPWFKNSDGKTLNGARLHNCTDLYPKTGETQDEFLVRINNHPKCGIKSILTGDSGSKHNTKYDENRHTWHVQHPVVQIFYKHGWRWGGEYGDVMHYELFNSNG